MRNRVKALSLALMLLGGLAGPLMAGLAEDIERAKIAREKKDYAEEVRLVKPLAEHGNAEGQRLLGVMYDEGDGVPRP